MAASRLIEKAFPLLKNWRLALLVEQTNWDLHSGFHDLLDESTGPGANTEMKNILSLSCTKTHIAVKACFTCNLDLLSDFFGLLDGSTGLGTITVPQQESDSLPSGYSSGNLGYFITSARLFRIFHGTLCSVVVSLVRFLIVPHV